jgi:hypothetical protein
VICFRLLSSLNDYQPFPGTIRASTLYSCWLSYSDFWRCESDSGVTLPRLLRLDPLRRSLRTAHGWINGLCDGCNGSRHQRTSFSCDEFLCQPANRIMQGLNQIGQGSKNRKSSRFLITCFTAYPLWIELRPRDHPPCFRERPPQSALPLNRQVQICDKNSQRRTMIRGVARPAPF